MRSLPLCNLDLLLDLFDETLPFASFDRKVLLRVNKASVKEEGREPDWVEEARGREHKFTFEDEV